MCSVLAAQAKITGLPDKPHWDKIERRVIVMKREILFFLLLFSFATATEFEQCAHLLNRTSFGITESSIVSCLEDKNYEATVKRLLDMPQAQEPIPLPDFASGLILPPKKFKKLNAEERKAFNKKRRQQQIALKQWWIKKMLTTSTPFRERMVLFWHNHFTSSIRKVQQPALMYRQIQLFRSYAVGNFAQLLHRIIEDPAMLIYLDNRANRKKHPNENLARELLELFTMGEGHYNEKDIKEVARSLTGYSLDKKRNFRFRKKQHDKGEKIIFGQKGNFDAHQMVDLVLEQNATAIFVVRKFWKAFVSDDPHEQEIDRIASIFRKNRYELKPMLYALFTSSSFTDPSNRGTMVKSPAELTIGTLRTFNRTDFNPKIVMQYCRRLGQDILSPPNVKGWPGGREWINANTLLIRKEFLSRLTRGKEMEKLDDALFRNPLIADSPEEGAAKTLLSIRVFLTPAHRFDATLQTILQHPLYQLK